MRKTVALIITIFIVVVLALFALYLTNLSSLHVEISPLYYHKTSSEFIIDIGIERAKQLLYDGINHNPPYPWRPWRGCYTNCGPNRACCGTSPTSSVCQRCICPQGCKCLPFPNYDKKCDSCYLEENITIPRGGKKGTYRIFVTGSKNSPTITVESQLEEAESVTTSP